MNATKPKCKSSVIKKILCRCEMIFLFCFLVDTACVPSNCYLRNLRNLVRIHVNLACSQSLYFLFKVRRERVIKCKPQGIY